MVEWRSDSATRPYLFIHQNTTTMEKYNYLDAVTSDVKDAILARYDMNELAVELEDRESFEQDLHDRLWIDDSVTGNASGSYTFNALEAEQYVCHNLDLLGEAFEEFCVGGFELEKGAEYCDVTIRCYLLPRAISAALDELEEEIDEADED